MGRRRHTPEQIITALREAEVGLANGKTVGMVSRELGISEQTYYRWRQEFGGMKVDQARRFKELEKENTSRRRLGNVRIGEFGDVHTGEEGPPLTNEVRWPARFRRFEPSPNRRRVPAGHGSSWH